MRGSWLSGLAALSFADLKDAWRSAPATPRDYDGDLPEALDRLVMAPRPKS
jgi:hypothetical protein